MRRKISFTVNARPGPGENPRFSFCQTPVLVINPTVTAELYAVFLLKTSYLLKISKYCIRSSDPVSSRSRSQSHSYRLNRCELLPGNAEAPELLVIAITA